MKKAILFLLILPGAVMFAHGGLSVGLPGAVKKQVSKLDEKVLADTKEQNKPAAAALAGNGAAEVSWASVPEASSYNLYLTPPSQLQAAAATAKTPNVSSPYYLAGLVNGTTYFYAVSSVANGVESALSPFTQFTPSSSLPLRPENVSCTGGYGQAALSWNPVSGAVSYNIYWGAASGVTRASAKISGVAAASYAHNGLAYGQTYYYRAAAVNAGGESLPGAETRCATFAQPLSYQIDPLVYTTLQRTVIPSAPISTSPAIMPYQVAKFAEHGYGVWQTGPGLAAEKRPDLMPAAYSTAAVTNTAGLLRFFDMTDVHITDKESPGQAIFFGYIGRTISAYSPAMLYNTQVLDAAVQTVNALNKTKKFDFGISLGDTVNNAQYNETRWYIDVLDGKVINPDSGVKDDPVSGPNNDYQDEFKAVGLDKDIPWYQAVGNHDHFWMGSFPIDDKARQAAIGTVPLNISSEIFTTAIGTGGSGYYVGAIDGGTVYGSVTGAGAVTSFGTPPTVPADADRRLLSRAGWMAEFLDTSSLPAGHGFSQAGAASGFGCYAFEPRPDMPLKVIVLDDTQAETDAPDGSNGPDYGHASLDQQRYDWLVSELDKGQAEQKLMIIAMHIPIGVEAAGSLLGWSSLAYVTEADLIAKLHSYPNLLLLVAGHRHLNTVTAFVSTDPAHPELGFWQVETKSLREFPQQFRTIDIVRNSDNSVSILAANVDPAVKDGSQAATARAYAIAANQVFNIMQPASPGSYGTYNAELFKQLSPEMQAKIQNYGTPLP